MVDSRHDKKGAGKIPHKNPPVGSFQKQNPPHFLINNLSTLYPDEDFNQRTQPGTTRQEKLSVSRLSWVLPL